MSAPAKQLTTMSMLPMAIAIGKSRALPTTATSMKIIALMAPAATLRRMNERFAPIPREHAREESGDDKRRHRQQNRPA